MEREHLLETRVIESLPNSMIIVAVVNWENGVSFKRFSSDRE